MKIGRKEVEYVARLARLALNEEETERFSHQLSAILEHMDRLNELDTEGVEPTSHVITLTNVFREDVVREGPWGQIRLSGAPEEESGHYRVPKVIE